MKEHPILFSSPMVRAIRENRKTQTRRVVKLQDPKDYEYGGAMWTREQQLDRCPYGVPGDRLYVKEATWIWCEKRPNGTTKAGRQKYRYVPIGEHVRYCADMPHSDSRPVTPVDSEPQRLWRWKSARFMPRWASRITLEITNVWVQRVQEISDGDAHSEGVKCGDCGGEKKHARDNFRELWDSINAKRGFSWASNPWIWAISFRRVGVQ